MAFCKNHEFLYFDRLIRTQKAEAVMSLIHASYQAKVHGGNKEDIARLLVSAYELFRFSAGTYIGDANQFASQYTIGHELGIWKNSALELSDLAIKVARNEITIKDYFDIVLLNYIQPIDNKIVHPLADVLQYVCDNQLSNINKEQLKIIFSWTSKHDENDINGLFNILMGTSYFEKVDNNILRIKYNPKDILNCCNKEYIGQIVNDVSVKFNDLAKYVEYLTTDHRSLQLIKDKYYSENNNYNYLNKENIDKNGQHECGYNKIYYGIPGCGKSWHIDNEVLKEVNEEKDVFRTTFYLDYSNSDFVGQIYPVVKGDNVTYEYVPGPFTKALERALTVEDGHMIYLVIEEINRGNAAAIFGDLFQLLDRLKEPKNGRVKGDSEYPISNQFIEGYFNKQNDNGKKIEFIEGNIYIPHNLTILATMNTSDQNVYPLDTAFQRRWDREKVVSKLEGSKYAELFVPGTSIKWKDFASKINFHMIEDCKDGSITEDKNLGPYLRQMKCFAMKMKALKRKKKRQFVLLIM